MDWTLFSYCHLSGFVTHIKSNGAPLKLIWIRHKRLFVLNGLYFRINIWRGKETESMAWHDMFSKHTIEFEISVNTANTVCASVTLNSLFVNCLIQFDLWTVCVKAHTNNQSLLIYWFSLQAFTFIFARIPWIVVTNIVTNETLCAVNDVLTSTSFMTKTQTKLYKKRKKANTIILLSKQVKNKQKQKRKRTK